MNNRDNFVWRPNDNSVQTNLRYDLEAEHWVKAFKGASTKSSASFSKDLMVIGLIISLIINLIFFVLICITELVKWILEKREAAAEIKRRETAQLNAQIVLKKTRKDDLKKLLSKLQLPNVNITERDPLFKKAALHVVNKQKVSIPILQFDLEIDFDQACIIIDDLMAAGIITKFNGKNPRKVLISSLETLNLLFEIEEETEKNKN